MSLLPSGKIEVSERYSQSPGIKAALARLQQLGVSVLDREATQGYDYEVRLPHAVKFPQAVLVEIGYLLAQLSDHKFPEEYSGFSWTTGAVPYWKPSENSGAREGIQFDVDPAYIYFRFNLVERPELCGVMPVRRKPWWKFW